MQPSTFTPAAPTTSLVPPPPQAPVDPRWQQNQYVVKERRLTLGRQYRIFDAGGALVAYCKQKMFRLREDIRFYTDENQQHELFRLQATKIIDFNGNFVVVDSQTGYRLGTLRRKGWKALIQDEWNLLDPWDRPLGTLKEDSTGMALIRRFVTNLVPYTYYLYAGPPGMERQAATVKERFQFFGDTYDVTLHAQNGVHVDPRLLLGLTVCVDALEGE